MENQRCFSYIEYKKDAFFKVTNNQNSISSGVNLFGVLDLYKDLLKIEVENKSSISSYAAPQGYRLLVEIFKYYEDFLCNFEMDRELVDVCVVNGATSALYSVFDYFAMKQFERVLLLGYSYDLFALLAQRNGIKMDVLISKEKHRILPSVTQIVKFVTKKKPEVICLTDPSNPSGEMYDGESFRQLLRVCKKYQCILLIDKCQRDELQLINKVDYFSISNIICEEQMYNQVIIVNSLSKIRGVPGLRVGYVLANKNVIDYLIYLNTITYWHCNSMCSFAITIDILYQLIYLDISHKNKYITDISQLLKKSITNIRTTKDIYNYISSMNIEIQAQLFCNEIIERYNTVQSNYETAKTFSIKNNIEITNMDGGFNFCMKNNRAISEDKLKSYLSRKYSLEVFTQENFCCKDKNLKKDYWIRISCAERKSDFQQKFLWLSDFMKNGI